MNRVKWINIVFLFTVFMSVVGGTIIQMLASLFGDSMMVRLLISQFILIVPTLVYIIGFRLDIRDTIRLRTIKISNIVLLILFAYLITPFMSLLSAISMLFSTNFISNEVNGIVSNNSLFVSVIVVALIPCILEESVYRGVFYNEYRKINPRKGIILSGLLFGFLHMNFNQFIYAFAMGMIFALLIEATDSIVSSMIVHFVINGTSVVTSYMIPKMYKYLENTTGQVQTVTTATNLSKSDIISLIISYSFTSIITCSLAFLVYRRIAKNSGRYEIVKGLISTKSNTKQIDREVLVESYYYHNSDSYDNSEYLNENNADYDKKETLQGDGVQKLVSIPLIFGIFICLFIMIYSEVMVRL